MVVFHGGLYFYCIYQFLFNWRVLKYNDLYSSNPLLVRRKASFTPAIRKAKDCGYWNICILWLACLMIQTMARFVSSANGLYDERRTNCIYKYRMKVSVDIFNFSALAGAFVLGSIIFFAYFKVFCEFVSHHNHTVASNLQPGNHSHSEEAKITKTLVIVILGFLFCWVPATTIQFINSVVYSQIGQLRIPNFVFLVQTIFIFTSSTVNPFFFRFTSKRFRKQYFELLGVLCPSAPQVTQVVVATS